MESFDAVDWPPMRLLFFLAFTGVFFYRSFPRPEWRWFLGLPVYWAYILFFYIGYAGMMTAGLSDLLNCAAEGDPRAWCSDVTRCGGDIIRRPYVSPGSITNSS